jgi:hypothetical protein
MFLSEPCFGLALPDKEWLDPIEPNLGTGYVWA